MIKITNLKKSYKSKLVLDSLNFDVKKGEIKALIGINGSGKSTLVDTICGVKKFDSGEVFVNDLSIADKSSKRILNNIIGYMPQTFCMFNDLTVFENLEYVCSVFNISIDNIDDVISKCYLSEYRDTLAQNLSGGYKQLLSLASILIHNPQIYILDEPTSAMDPIFRHKFWKIIKECNKNGVTVLLITHYIEELLECDSFSLLANGSIRYDGNVDEFKKNGFLNIEEILSKYSNGVGK